ncbi:MAG: hypothetical protein GX106_06845 [Candidatus Cloacimonetes bacterium]|jgi:proteic killer suppression protein|nr:hypothetical protein [Candidatus Cloacimonadota bacterium]
MEISFISRKIEKLCLNEKEMIRKYGDLSNKLKQRLSELEAAANLTELPPFAGCHPLIGNYKHCYALNLKQPYRLIIEPNWHKLGLKKGEQIELAEINSIVIVGVDDYH